MVKPTEHFVESSGAAAAIAVANSSWFSDSLFSRGGVHPLLALAAVLLSWLLGLLVAGYMVEPLKKLVELKDY